MTSDGLASVDNDQDGQDESIDNGTHIEVPQVGEQQSTRETTLDSPLSDLEELHNKVVLRSTTSVSTRSKSSRWGSTSDGRTTTTYSSSSTDSDEESASESGTGSGTDTSKSEDTSRSGRTSREQKQRSQHEQQQVVDFSGQGLSNIPPVIFQRIAITRLNLSGNNLGSIPSEIAALQALRHLDISRNNLCGRQSSTTPSDIGTRDQDLLSPLPDDMLELTQLQTLLMADCCLTKIPPIVFRLTELRKLNISRNCIGQLSTEIGSLRQLRCLWLRHMGLTTIPVQLSKCTHLQLLYLGGNMLNSLPDELSKLKRLQYLQVDASHFIELVRTSKQMQSGQRNIRENLTRPDLCKLIPEDLFTMVMDTKKTSEMTDANKSQLHIQTGMEDDGKEEPDAEKLLERIDAFLRTGQLQSFHIPNVLFKLPSLQLLQLEQCQLNRIPSDLSILKQLQSVNFSKNYLSEIPSGIYQLGSSLCDLNLSFNNLDATKAILPASFGESLPLLQRLWLRKCGLRIIESGALAGLHKLELFDIGSNSIAHIPNELHNLRNLRRIDWSHNEITSLPSSIGCLSYLSDLDVTSNRLNDLPSTLCNLKELRLVHAFSGLEKCGLWLRGNPLRQIDQFVWQSSTTDQLWIYLRYRELRNKCKLQPVKIIILGPPKSGKSTLIRHLLDYCGTCNYKQPNKFEILKPYQNTESTFGDPSLHDSPATIHRTRSPNGLDLVFVELSTPTIGTSENDEDDFSQDYQAIQAHLFDRQALYLITFSTHKIFNPIAGGLIDTVAFDQTVGYWIRVIAAHSPGSCVKIVGTHANCVDIPVDVYHHLIDEGVIEEHPQRNIHDCHQWFCEPLEVVRQTDASGTSSREDLPENPLTHVYRKHLDHYLKKVEGLLNNHKVNLNIQLFPELTFLDLTRIVRPITTQSSVCRSRASRRSTRFLPFCTEIKHLVDELERRFVSNLFSHRSYRVPVGWEKFMRQLNDDYAHKLVVNLQSDGLNHLNTKNTSCSDYVHSELIKSIGLEDIETFLRHFQSIGQIIRFDMLNGKSGYIALRPSRFLKLIAGVVSPEYVLSESRDLGFTSDESRLKYFNALTGWSMERLVEYSTESFGYQNLHPSFVRAVFPLFLAGPFNKVQPSREKSPQRRKPAKSPSLKVRVRSKSGRKSARESLNMGPNTPLLATCKPKLAKATLCWLAQLLGVAFQTTQCLTPSNWKLDWYPAITCPMSGSQFIQLTYAPSFTLAPISVNNKCQFNVAIWFPLVKPWGLFQRLSVALAQLLSHVTPKSILFQSPQIGDHYASPNLTDRVELIESGSRIIIQHELFHISVQEYTASPIDSGLCYGMEMKIEADACELQMISSPLEEGNILEDEIFPSYCVAKFEPLQWFVNTCNQLTSSSEGLVHNWTLGTSQQNVQKICE